MAKAKVGMAVGVIGSTSRAALFVALSALTLAAAAFATRQAFAQEPADDEVAAPLSADALAELVGPIALYPDDLVGIVLPASTYPLQVVQAARFLDDRAKNPSLKPNEDWDDSIVALLNYPEVVKLMNDDLDWTWRLGDAVIGQRADVLDAIQGFRDQAYAAGNLRSDDRQVVENDDQGAIAIKPADPEVIYVPYYEPERVVVYQRTPVFHYYPVAYPVYYYPYPLGYSFHTGYFWGVTSVFSIGWHTHFLYLHDHNYRGHPYYGRSYYDRYYYRRGGNVAVSRGGYVWEPHYRRGAQPFTRSDGRRIAGSRDGRGAGAQGGGYRNGNGGVNRSGSVDRNGGTNRNGSVDGNGGTNRSAGQQRHQPLDPGAAANRGRATPGASPRADGSGGTYRSNGSNGRTAPTAERRNDAAAGDQPSGRADSGSVPSGRQTNQPVRNREPSQQSREQYRSAPQPNAQPRLRETAPPRTDAPAVRSPGQYRSGGTAQRSAAPQQRAQGAAPSVRVAPPSASGSRTVGRVDGGSASDGERAAPQRAERSADPGSTAPRADNRAAPSYNRGGGGGGESRSNGGRNTSQPVRGGRATER